MKIKIRELIDFIQLAEISGKDENGEETLDSEVELEDVKKVLRGISMFGIKHCLYCGSAFVPTDGRQKFCRRRNWQKETSESQCSILYRQHKRRNSTL